MAKVLYIVGSNRSGSTLLQTLLGAHASIDAFGELCGFPRDWQLDRTCTCGRTARTCELWSDVHARWTRILGADPMVRYGELTASWERFVAGPHLMWRSRRSSAEFEEHLRLLGAFFQALAAASGSPVLVDSSKTPSRAFLLSRIPGIDLHLLHLVRDPRGVAYSFAKPSVGQRGWQQDVPTWKTAAYWSAYNLGSELAALGVPDHRVHRVRYEDLVRDPAPILEGIGEFVGLDTTDLAARVSEGVAVPMQHMLSGNRLRKTGKPIKLRPDHEWTRRLPRSKQAAIRLLVGWQMRRYGYRSA